MAHLDLGPNHTDRLAAWGEELTADLLREAAEASPKEAQWLGELEHVVAPRIRAALEDLSSDPNPDSGPDPNHAGRTSPQRSG